MTRHQRRKAARSKTAAAERREIVRNNLSTPVVRERTVNLISGVYANRMDRARGRGTTPMTPSNKRTLSVRPGACTWNRDA